MNAKIYRLKTIQLMVLLVVSFAFVLVILTGFTEYEANIDGNETVRIRETVEKYAVQCYATEGAYPPSIKYLSDHYGLIINKKYIYEYEAVAENIKPIVQVFLRVDNSKE